MNKELTHITAMYKITDALLNKSLGLIDEKHYHVRPNDTANSFLWVVGHITGSRYGVARELGVEEEYPYLELFNQKAEPQESSAYPSMDEIK
jgi:hypothetical protein